MSAEIVNPSNKEDSFLSFDQALTNNKNGDTDKNLLQKIPDISDLKLPDGIKADEELPSKPKKAVVSDVVSLNTSDASNKDPQNTSEQNIALSLPTTDNKSTTNNKALAVDDNAIPNTSAENANSKNNIPLSTTGNLSEPKTDKYHPKM